MGLGNRVSRSDPVLSAVLSCIFYGDNGLCRIHPVKPFDCRHWPLHPSILGDEAPSESSRGLSQVRQRQELKGCLRARAEI